MNISGVSAATNYAAAVRGDKTSGTEKTAKNGMSGGFIERIKTYAKEDAKKGVYMSEGFTQMRLAHMKQYVSPDRSGPKNQVMSAIQAAPYMGNVKSFLKIVKKYTEPTELTPQLLHEFVEKIVVHEADKSSGHRVQRIDVHYNFIGEIDFSPEYRK